MKNILFVSHDATRTGAPIAFLHLLRWFKTNTSFNFTILLRHGGELENEFQEISLTNIWHNPSYSLLKKIKNKIFEKFNFKNKTHVDLIRKFKKETFNLIYFNSVASSELIIPLKTSLRLPVILHVHELDIAIKQFCGKELFVKVIPHVDHFIAVSNAVKKILIENYHIESRKISVVYESIPAIQYYKETLLGTPFSEFTNINSDAFIVLASGTTDWRKGADLFIKVAEYCLKSSRKIHFIWLGGNHLGIEYEKLMYDVQKLGLEKNVHFIGSRKNILRYFKYGHIFILPSREDPFPLVCLEAASAELPIICFENAGGMPEFVEEDAGIIVPYLDTKSMAKAILKLFSDPILRINLGEMACKKVTNYDTSTIGKLIESLIYKSLI